MIVAPMDLNLVQWMLDTRDISDVSKGPSLKEQMHEFKDAAKEVLALLTEEERTAVLRYFYVRDAKMSLASHLLKHLAITKLCGIPWSETVITRDHNLKPCYKDPSGAKVIEFNVSHQAGIVTLVATSTPGVDLGTDVVCVNERNDYAIIEKDGFFSWIDIHADVFAPSEIEYLKFDTLHLDLPVQLDLAGYGRDAISRCNHRHKKVSWNNAAGESQEIDSNVVIDAKLRRFYALWCLREAFVKMTGEALLAEWLRKLEFRSFQVPAPIDTLDDASLVPGEVVTECEIFMKGEKLNNVSMELRTYGSKYMIASAVRKQDGSRPQFPFPEYKLLNFELDILPAAQRPRSQ